MYYKLRICLMNKRLMLLVLIPSKQSLIYFGLLWSFKTAKRFLSTYILHDQSNARQVGSSTNVMPDAFKVVAEER